MFTSLTRRLRKDRSPRSPANLGGVSLRNFVVPSSSYCQKRGLLRSNPSSIILDRADDDLDNTGLAGAFLGFGGMIEGFLGIIPEAPSGDSPAGGLYLEELTFTLGRNLGMSPVLRERELEASSASDGAENDDALDKPPPDPPPPPPPLLTAPATPAAPSRPNPNATIPVPIAV